MKHDDPYLMVLKALRGSAAGPLNATQRAALELAVKIGPRVISMDREQQIVARLAALEELGLEPTDDSIAEGGGWKIMAERFYETPLPFPATIFIRTPGDECVVCVDDEKERYVVSLSSDGFDSYWAPTFDVKSGEKPEDFGAHSIGILDGAGYLLAMNKLVEAANVDLVESEEQAVRGSRAARDKVINYEIRITQSKKRYKPNGESVAANYGHRFERRGNFAHHYEMTAEGKPNRIFAKWSTERPDKIVLHEGRPCVKIWRPPTVVGPSDKPFVPKIRKVA